MRLSLVVLLLVSTWSPSTTAGPHILQELSSTVRIDWTRGAILSIAAAPGDPRAPSAGVARTKARRVAREKARDKMNAVIESVPLAWGGQLRELEAKDKLADVRDAVAHATVVDETLGSDGSSIVTVAVGIEEIRSAIVGPSRPGDVGIAAIVVDARKLALPAAVGYVIRVGGSSHAGPSLFFTSEADARADSRVGEKAPSAVALKVNGRDVEVSGISPEQLDDAQRSSAVVAFIVKRGKKK